MTKPIIVLVVLLTAAGAFAKDKTTVNYVGQGRYSCSGDSYQCAQIDQQNRQHSQNESDRYERTRREEVGRYERSREEYREREGYERRTHERN